MKDTITYDDLVQTYQGELMIKEHPLHENPLLRKKKCKGLYYYDGETGLALIENKLNSVDKKCILAEEIGHHYTSYGNILNMKYASSRKQEHKARVWGAKKLISQSDFLEAIRLYDCASDQANALEVNMETLETYISTITYTNS